VPVSTGLIGGHRTWLPPTSEQRDWHDRLLPREKGGSHGLEAELFHQSVFASIDDPSLVSSCRRQSVRPWFFSLEPGAFYFSVENFDVGHSPLWAIDRYSTSTTAFRSRFQRARQLGQTAWP
jgi:hypothetical protein